MWCCTCVVVSVLQCHSCGRHHIANVYKPPTEHWNNTNLPPVLPHPAVLVGDFNSHHPDWGYHLNGESLQEWALNSDYLLLHDVKQCGTFHSARWQCDYSPDLCWISTTVTHSLPPLWFLVTSPQSAPTFSYSHWPPASHHQRSPTQKMECHIYMLVDLAEASSRPELSTGWHRSVVVQLSKHVTTVTCVLGRLFVWLVRRLVMSQEIARAWCADCWYIA